ncbi:MAG: M48 family metalloprotease [Lewinellaceae bacterium]|nr:M48 family metalloprotease [Lewinellaceae bacterium]
MKYAILFLAFCFSTTLPAQTLISIEHSCSFDGEEEQTDFYTFDASKEADRIVGEILNSVNLAKNFVVKSADCKNALATTEGRQRYILYNTTFLEKFKETGKVRWGAYCVLAHEIGHHLNNDDFTISDSKKRKVLELQADKFAGGVLYNLGASLEEAQAGIELLQSTGESNTHPPARARAEAMASGWKNAQEVHRHRAERDGDRTEDTTPPKNTNQPTKSEPQGKDSGAKLPEIEKKPPTQPQVDQTAVSDQLFRNALVGQWEATYSDGYSNINNIVTLNANGTGVGYLYMNGILANTVYVSWQVQRGYYMEQYAGTQYYSTLAIAFNGNNYMSLTMAETNMPNGLPVGTVLYYTRRY